MPTTRVTAPILLTLLVAGCGSGGEAVTPAAPLSPSALASQIAMVDSDLTKGGKVRLIEAGDQVKGQVTLDNCGYKFKTEAHRVARIQVDLLTPEGQPTGASNEVVVYDSAEQAAKALSEFRKSITGCRKKVFHKSAVAGVPKLRSNGTVSSAPSLPVKDNAVATIAYTAKGSSRHVYVVAVFQRQGTVLSGLYLQSTTEPTSDDVTFMKTLAGATGKRLAAS